MSKAIASLFLLLTFVVPTVSAQQGQTGSVYPNGSEGIQAGSVPPPGVYFRWYSNYYQQTTLKDPNGTEMLIGFKVSGYAEVPRLIYVTDKRILGANYGMEVLVPIIKTDLSINAADFHQVGTSVGDVIFGPGILAWHGKRYDATAAFDIFAPTGAWDGLSKTKAGSDEWTFMPAGGFTYYFDPAKTWSGSALARMEFHNTKRHEDVKMGDDFHFEWGFGKALNHTLTIGPAGYAQWKVTEDGGKDVTWDRTVKDRTFAAGPEVQLAFPKYMTFVSARGLAEFGARGRGQGTAVWLTVTHRFDSGKTER